MPQSASMTADGRLYSPYIAQLVPLCRALPGAHWSKRGRYWQFSTAPKDRRRVLELVDKMRAVLDRERVTLEVAEQLYATTEQERRASGHIAELEAMMKLRPYEYQRAGIEWLGCRPRALLGDDMGLGKTIQALWALPLNARAIVVCPASLKLNWQHETARWRPDLEPTVLEGYQSFRLPKQGQLLITNYEILPPLKPITVKPKKCAKRPFYGPHVPACRNPTGPIDGCPKCDPRTSKRSNKWSRRAPEPTAERYDLSGCHLIIDEASFCKNSKAQRHKVMRTLGRTADVLWALSGTPLLNQPFDLLGVLRVGGMDQEAFGGWGNFIRYFNGRKNEWGGWELGRPRPEVHEMLRRVMLRRRKEEVLSELPTLRLRDLVVPVNLGPQLRLALDEVWEELPKDQIPDFQHLSDVRRQLADSRIDAMLELVSQHEEAKEPLLVFSAHRAPIEALTNRDGWATIIGGTNPAMRQQICDNFRAGQLKGVGLTIAAGGYGLNLQGASHVLFVDLSWVPGDNRQAIDRTRRIGSSAESILVTRLVSNHPLDLHVLQLLDQKEQLVETVVEGRSAT